LLNGRPLEALWNMTSLGYSPGLRAEDLDWLLTDGPGRTLETERRLAIDAAVRICREAGESATVLARIEGVARKDCAMAQAYDSATRPPPERPERVEQERELNETNDRTKAAQSGRDETWTRLVDDIRRNPNQLRQLPPSCPLGASARLLHLWHLLTLTVDINKGYAIESVQSLEPILGLDATGLLRGALISHWRAWRPTLKSGKKLSRRNEMSYSDCIGITGVTLEAKLNNRWAEALTSDEATLAAGNATIEPSGFPPWLSDLAVARPDEVRMVLEAETAAGLLGPEPQYDVLDDIRHFGGFVQELIAPALLERLEQRTDLPAAAIRRLLDIISRGITTDRERFITLASERFSRDGEPSVSALYAAALFNVDAAAATNALTAKLSLLDLPSQKSLVERLLPRLFGGRLFPLDVSPEKIPFQALEQLVWIAFSTVRVVDDNRRDYGLTYTPDERDDAEEARRNVFNWLANTPGRATYEALRRLIDHPDKPISRARLLAIARDRAAKDSESAPWRATDTYEFEKSFQTAPYTAADLQFVAIQRISEIQHELVDSDFAQAGMVRLLQNERDVQIWVADRLRIKQGRSYSIEREVHVVDEKEPDIRLRTKASDASVPVEIKVAEDWAFRDLEAALTEQLCGRYLRAKGARCGILLLVHRKPRALGWKNPADGTLMRFDQVVDHLRALAAKIAGESPDAPQPEIAILNVANSGK
jgi:hypothetical protein